MARRTQIVASLFALSTLCLLASGCAHHRDVRPGAKGVHRVLLRGPERHKIEQDAIRQANHFCEQRKRSAAFVNEENKYTGTMDESTHNTLRAASKATGVVGHSMKYTGGSNERNSGSILAGAGMFGNIMTSGDAYTVDMRFKCI